MNERENMEKIKNLILKEKIVSLHYLMRYLNQDTVLLHFYQFNKIQIDNMIVKYVATNNIV